MELSNLDNAIASPLTYATPARYEEVFAWLRDNDPVRWVEPDGHRPFWLVSRHAEICEVEKHNGLFLNAPRILLRPEAIEAVLAQGPGNRGDLIRSINAMDGNEHRQMRGITSRDFLRPNIEKLAGELDEVANEFVQRLIDKAPECDFTREVAIWYPLRVIMTLLGVPREDEALMLELTHGVFSGPDKRAAAEAFFDYFRPIVADRRQTPRDDLASKIANARIDGEPLNDFEMLSYFLNIATAGHDTTSATIAGGLLALIEHPAEMAKLRTDPALLDSAADEMIRWVAPVKHFFRTAAADYDLAGHTIHAGEAVMVAFPSGGRDGAVFVDASRFRVDRSPNRHTALGHGVHACLGQHLARLEIRLFFRRLLERVGDIQLAGEPSWSKSVFISGLESLPIRFSVRCGLMRWRKIRTLAGLPAWFFICGPGNHRRMIDPERRPSGNSRHSVPVPSACRARPAISILVIQER